MKIEISQNEMHYKRDVNKMEVPEKRDKYEGPKTEEEWDEDEERDEDINQLERSCLQYTAISRSSSEAFVTKLIITEDVKGRDGEEWIQFISDLNTPMSASMTGLVLPATWAEGIKIRNKTSWDRTVSRKYPGCKAQSYIQFSVSDLT